MIDRIKAYISDQWYYNPKRTIAVGVFACLLIYGVIYNLVAG